MEPSERAWREASQLFGHRQLIPFEAEDPFNAGNRLMGLISRQLDRSMGSLYIEFVNGRYRPQAVWATPKMHYPFGRQGGYSFPSARRVRCYAKLDGTNVLAYAYRDRDQTYVTYKPRLRPVLTDSRWGAWRGLWGEILERHPAIPQAVREGGSSLSFELYGHRNPHLVEYEVPLEAALLFSVGPRGEQAPPLWVPEGLPSAPELLWEVGARPLARDELIERYRATEAQLQRGLDAAGGRYVLEGAVLWLETGEGRWLPLKAKPEAIREIHFAQGAGLGHALVRQACYKAVENGWELQASTVAGLLAEDWPAPAVEAYLEEIGRVVLGVRAELEFKAAVLDRYRESGLNVRADKAAVMRHMSQFFTREQMRRVAAVLLGEG